MPQHVHVDEEELFFVLAGSGLSWQGDAIHEVRAGDLVHEPLDVLAYASGSPMTTALRATLR